MVFLSQLAPGNTFIIPALHMRGVLIDVNECAATVQFIRDSESAPQQQSWSPYTEVIREDVKLDPVAILNSLVCQKCGRECSSTSGYTLHVKSCTGQSAANTGGKFECPGCGKQCSSSSGFTLHKKQCHMLK